MLESVRKWDNCVANGICVSTDGRSCGHASFLALWLLITVFFTTCVGVSQELWTPIPDTSHTEQFILFGHFACKKWETLIAFELSKSHLQFGDLFVSLRLLFEVWRVKSVRLMSNQSRNIWV